MMKFEVSVVIPVFGATHFVETAVNSALELDCVKEVIVVFDEDTPALNELAQRWQKSQDRIQIYRHPNGENKGAAASRNLGIKVASGPYLAFLDADDWFLPNRFDFAADIFQQFDSIDFVYEAVAANFEKEEARQQYLAKGNNEITYVSHLPVSGIEMMEALLCEKDFGWFHLNGLTLKKSSLQILFDEQLRQMQDTDFILRLCLSSHHIKGGPHQHTVAIRRVHSNNRILNNPVEMQDSKKQLVQKWFDLMQQHTFSKKINQKIWKDKLSLNLDYHHPGLWLWFQLRLKALLICIRFPNAALKYLWGAKESRPAVIEQ